jgi:hypothetical protein
MVQVNAMNPAGCMPHNCGHHGAMHVHGEGCGHKAVKHGNHTDYLVDGHLHHPHDGHCDHHGTVDR